MAATQQRDFSARKSSSLPISPAKPPTGILTAIRAKYRGSVERYHPLPSQPSQQGDCLKSKFDFRVLFYTTIDEKKSSHFLELSNGWTRQVVEPGSSKSAKLLLEKRELGGSSLYIYTSHGKR
ncbi:MAG: hypothetical protein ACXAEU_16675 [Candidatus Hodarchaeales archaeon]